MNLLRYAAVLALALVLAAAQPARAADIGGPFSLTDHHGNRVTQDSYAGKYLLVFFGYTYCPDVCPTELLVMGQALDELGDDAARVQGLFITVDPERDSVEKLAEYVPHFHPDLVGLTGTVEEVAAAGRAYRVYFRKEPAAEGEDGYLMAHSSIVYLMSPENEYLAHFVLGQSAEVVAERIEEFLDAD
jgi:cytochrome oxidase Cu insertion factor (SCO1/SenC/PrrC family)